MTLLRFLVLPTLALALVVASARLVAEPATLGLLPPIIVESTPPAGAFPLFDPARSAPLWHDAGEHPGVVRALGDLRDDFVRGGAKPPELGPTRPSDARPIIVGTLGRNAFIDSLASSGRIDVRDLAGKWESFVITTVENPAPGVDQALLVVGSDKRGTIYGIYELSEQLGVSPWYWWADVPPRKHAAAYVLPGRHASGEPAVKYRGIFLNDEAPALTNWTSAKFGGYNHRFYTKVFELLLRLRANYLWPAMWNNAFNEDDPENPRLADEYGVVMGTSHHEPMLRAHKEWTRRKLGPWDYAKNEGAIKTFFTEGIRRNRNYESLVTIGMRGDGDEPMSEDANVALLERIVKDQREIIARETGRPAERTPQLWALYKEVQEYFEKGMRVPDDVTLLWCDDNWGNIRRLPTPEERARPGGAGVYYHFDYVGSPRCYKWLNTVPLEKVWEQMHLAWRHEATRVWIVNVGDLKPMEVPIEFFLRYAWDPARWPANTTDAFLRAWATREFGPAHAAEVAALVAGYTRLNGLRKPEQLEPETFSIVHERESERIVGAWSDLRARARALDARLPADSRPAFYQLVLHPIESCAIVNELYQAVARNRLYAVQGRASANLEAARARELFAADAAMTARWDALLDGKWKHLMDQARIGYTTWEQPNLSAMPPVGEVAPRAKGELAVAVEGDRHARPGGYGLPPVPRLPTLHAWATDGSTTRWFDIFNRGSEPLRFTVETRDPWLRLSVTEGTLESKDIRVEVSADWSRAPEGTTIGRMTVRPAAGEPVRIEVPAIKPSDSQAAAASGAHVELDKRIAIEAIHFANATGDASTTWQVLENHGRTLGGMTLFPTTAPSVERPGGATPRLEYPIWVESAGDARLTLVVSPTQAYAPGRGLRLAVSLDAGAPQIVDLLADRSGAAWERMVSDGVNQVAVPLRGIWPGRHTIKVWFVDPGIVLQRLALGFSGSIPVYLGPRESPRAP